MKRLLPLLLLLNTVAFAQTDSLVSGDKWKVKHTLGVELLGMQLPYSVYYELSLNKNKHHFGTSYNFGLFKYYSPLNVSNGIYFNYKYGLKHLLTISLGGGIYMYTKNLSKKFSFNLRDEVVQSYSPVVSIGYNRQFEHFMIGGNVCFNTLIYYRKLYAPENQIAFKYYPTPGLIMAYRF